MSTKIYFSEHCHVDPAALAAHGALDVSLVGDLPLFIDPFLLFTSEKPAYRQLHIDIINYLRVLKDLTSSKTIDPGLVDAWFRFPEVRQTWLGFTASGNKGHGLGTQFAHALHAGFRTVCRDFGDESVTEGSHLEKLGLIRSGVGRDMISDFTTNLVVRYLATYTEEFSRAHLADKYRRPVRIRKCTFDYSRRMWLPGSYELPWVNGDYVLLSPKDILTKDDAWINRADLVNRFTDIAESLPDAELRWQLNKYLADALSRYDDPTREQRNAAITSAIDRFPGTLDYYIRDREMHGSEAQSVSSLRVSDAEQRFIIAVRELVRTMLEPTGFYGLGSETYAESMKRLLFIKDVVENKGGHRFFHLEGRPIEREADLQLIYRLAWYGTPSDVSREVNDGRGPADFKISRGAADKTIVEFKLANNSKLEQNLQGQTPIYEAASDTTQPSIKAIMRLRRLPAARCNLGSC